jgi:hypothetical protein
MRRFVWMKMYCYRTNKHIPVHYHHYTADIMNLLGGFDALMCPRFLTLYYL